uniref:Hemopexin-like n=1 Tax=Callorhinchus milii TaxID=7868 RepID=A0A4W3GI58_CALMI
MLDLLTNIVKEKHWPALGRCTAAMRWLEKYYCFQGVRFTHFNPISGSVPTGYPKEARNYFMRCAGFGHHHGSNSSFHATYQKCSNSSFDGFSVDAIGRMYAFRGNWYYRLDTKQDGWHPWRINSSWPSLHGKINGVFTWDKKIYFIQGSQLFVYRTEAQYVLIEGYPKPVQDELGINGSQVDATFMCQQSSILYVVMGNEKNSSNLPSASFGRYLKTVTTSHRHTYQRKQLFLILPVETFHDLEDLYQVPA